MYIYVYILIGTFLKNIIGKDVECFALLVKCWKYVFAYILNRFFFLKWIVAFLTGQSFTLDSRESQQTKNIHIVNNECVLLCQ